ncbi:hypothetical protein V6N13_028300 [Hibiscus sabdariffa]|uniref:ATPase AAA-type core domain-containing protein n=1 Tax=Hibiscus sabdariffa TaxID=183260 RepID=A0ABR2DB72_9ROSI
MQDHVWSSCGGERIIVFTTNYVEKLDPALIRRGRMDKHIELSYCCFDAFKVFAKNYLEIDSHSLFAEIETLLGETKMTPADVAGNLMPKSEYDQVETCLKRLVEALKEAKKKAEDEARLMAEKEEEKQKQKSEKEGKEVKEIGLCSVRGHRFGLKDKNPICKIVNEIQYQAKLDTESEFHFTMSSSA